MKTLTLLTSLLLLTFISINAQNLCFDLEYNYSDYDTGGVAKAGDFNNDGISDILWAGSINTPSTDAKLFTGNGNGTFQSPSLIDIDYSRESLSFNDFNNDGNLDYATVGMSGLKIFSGDGNAGFANSYSDPLLKSNTWFGMLGVISEDLNQDNNLDIIAGEFRAGYNLVLYSGNGTGNMLAYDTIKYNNIPIFDFSLNHINNDGYLDLIVSADGSFYYHLGNGNGTFNSPQVVYMPANMFANCWYCRRSKFEFSDFNDDGILDVASYTDSSLHFKAGMGNGLFSPTVSIALPISSFKSSSNTGYIDKIKAVDLDSDGDNELLIATNLGTLAVIDYQSFNAQVLFNLPDLSATSHVRNINNIVVEDLNNDGLKDIFLSVKYTGWTTASPNSDRLYSYINCSNPFSAIKEDLFAESKGIKAYSDHASKRLHVDVQGLFKSDCEIVLRDIIGNQLLIQSAYNEEIDLDCSGIPSGIYIIEARDASSRYNKKVYIP